MTRLARCWVNDIAELSFRGADDTLTLTRNTQPVLLTHAVACLRVFQQLTDGRIEPHACAGHSLGEYSALVAAGVLSFDAALHAGTAPRPAHG